MMVLNWLANDKRECRASVIWYHQGVYLCSFVKRSSGNFIPKIAENYKTNLKFSRFICVKGKETIVNKMEQMLIPNAL